MDLMAVENPVRIAIIYYSSTGTIHSIANEFAEASQRCGASVRLLRVAELAPRSAVESQPAWVRHTERTKDVPLAVVEDVVWADAVVFGSPSRFGNVAAQLKQFVDTLGSAWATGALADKAYSGFTSGGTTHGGIEATLLAMYNMVYHFGGVVIPPGHAHPDALAEWNPYGTSHVLGASGEPIGEPTRRLARAHAIRVVRYAGALRAMRHAPKPIEQRASARVHGTEVP